MNRFRSKIETILNAATFAEANEHETALRFLEGSQRDEDLPERAWGRKSSTTSRDERTTVRRAIEDHFMAVAFAEAGAFETAQKMLPNYRRKQTVLLAIEGEQPNQATFDYAVNLCRRIDASLHILQIVHRSCPDEEDPSEALAQLIPVLEREAIPFKVTRRQVGSDDILYDHLRNHRDVSVAIVDSPSLRDSASTDARWQEIFRKISRKLSVPLVTALEKESVENPTKARGHFA
ncbi:hypothetical protein ACFL2Q_18445 [Thermodesulfobacteriota bacterium]